MLASKACQSFIFKSRPLWKYLLQTVGVYFLLGHPDEKVLCFFVFMTLSNYETQLSSVIFKTLL